MLFENSELFTGTIYMVLHSSFFHLHQTTNSLPTTVQDLSSLFSLLQSCVCSQLKLELSKGVIFNPKHVCVCASSGWVTFANVNGFWKSLCLTLVDNMASIILIMLWCGMNNWQSTQTNVIFNPKHVCGWRMQQRKQLPEPFDLFREHKRKRVYVWPQTVFENQTVCQPQTCLWLKITP